MKKNNNNKSNKNEQEVNTWSLVLGSPPSPKGRVLGPVAAICGRRNGMMLSSLSTFLSFGTHIHCVFQFTLFPIYEWRVLFLPLAQTLTRFSVRIICRKKIRPGRWESWDVFTRARAWWSNACKKKKKWGFEYWFCSKIMSPFVSLTQWRILRQIKLGSN